MPEAEFPETDVFSSERRQSLAKRAAPHIKRAVNDAEFGYLYGSAAQGTAKKGSDTDILVVVSGPVNLATMQSRFQAIENEFRRTNLSAQDTDELHIEFVGRDNWSNPPENAERIRAIKKQKYMRLF